MFLIKTLHTDSINISQWNNTNNTVKLFIYNQIKIKSGELTKGCKSSFQLNQPQISSLCKILNCPGDALSKQRVFPNEYLWK